MQCKLLMLFEEFWVIDYSSISGQVMYCPKFLGMHSTKKLHLSSRGV